MLGLERGLIVRLAVEPITVLKMSIHDDGVL